MAMGCCEGSAHLLGPYPSMSRFSSFEAIPGTFGGFQRRRSKRVASSTVWVVATQSDCVEQPVLVVVGGGAAGIFGALRAKSVCPKLEVIVLEKGQLLSKPSNSCEQNKETMDQPVHFMLQTLDAKQLKVRVSGGGRCNVTTGLHVDPLPLAGQYPRGHKELRGAFFRTHGPQDTVAWFTQHGVSLKKEEDGRIFPVSDNSATIVECLLNEARCIGVRLQTRASVSSISVQGGGGFDVQLARDKGGQSKLRAEYVLLATGSSRQGYDLAKDLGHSLVEPQPSLFTLKVKDPTLAELAGVSFGEVRAELEIPGQKQRDPHLSQTGPLLITHWGLSGPVVLRLSAWAARHLFSSNYQGTLWVDFVPNFNGDSVYKILAEQRQSSLKRKLGGAAPIKLTLVRRFWQYLLQRENLDKESLWAVLSSKAMRQLAGILKRCPFRISGKGEFKDEFVTAGGVPLAEVNLKTMESKLCASLFLAGEVLDIDGVTGGFNFQFRDEETIFALNLYENAWTGGHIAGSAVASLAHQRLERTIMSALDTQTTL